MDDEQWLRTTLTAGVPDPPAMADRSILVRSAHLRRRRVRVVTGLGATAAIVAAASVAPSVILGDADPLRATGTVALVDTVCPPPERAPARDFSSLPPGAVSVRLCGGVGTPSDALTMAVGRLVHQVDESPAYVPPTHPCAFDYVPGYQLIFGYPDGRVRVVAGSLSTCGGFAVGSSVRENPRATLDTFVGLLRAQRAVTTPPTGLPPALACRHSRFADPPGLVSPADLTHAVLCVDRGGAVTTVALRDDEVRTLTLDAVQRSGLTVGPHEPCNPGPTEVTLVGSTAWGERLSLTDRCGVLEYSGGTWRPGPLAQAVLRSAVRRAR